MTQCYRCDADWLDRRAVSIRFQEAVADSLEELWISYNNIERMKGISVLRKLSVLYMSNNAVKEWAEFTKLNDLPNLVDLVFVGKTSCVC